MDEVTVFSKEEERCFAEWRSRVVAYIAEQGTRHGRIGEIPAWFVDPYISIWAVESGKAPRYVGWWVIWEIVRRITLCVREIGCLVRRWNHSRCDGATGPAPILRGDEPKEWSVHMSGDIQELAKMMALRADLLNAFARNDALSL